ncbi:MAG: M23 family metallopeptidase [bacterium]|nr:M23 family metallopeptidase [bacterium]
MDFKKASILLFLFLLCLSRVLPGITLPVKDAKVTSTFGESRNDHFHNGLDFGGGEQDVRAVKDGKVVFYSDKRDFPFQSYLGSGNFVLVEHKDNTRTYYMHLKEGSINKTNYSLKEGSYLGRTSDTGHSYGIHLHFSLEKIQPLEIMNPLKLFKEELTDTLKPRIESVLVKVDGSDPMAVFDTITLNSGNNLSLYVKASDYFQNSMNKVAPYKITYSVNSEKFREYVFDKFIVKNNYYYLPPNFSFQDIYQKDGLYFLGDIVLRERRYDITLTVEDLYGNRTTTERHILVRK